MKIKSISNGGLAIALLTICSWISIPCTIPFTMQTFAIFLIHNVFGGKYGTLYISCYIGCGLFGLPVFSNFQGGISVLLGPTGGYLLGFLISSLFLWATFSLWSGKKDRFLLFSLIGLFLCYSFGTLWFCIVDSISLNITSLFHVWMVCVFPFVIPDIVKIFLADRIGKRLVHQLPWTR